MTKVSKKNKLLLWYLLPLSLLWSLTFLGYSILTPDSWVVFPFIITVLVLITLSFTFAEKKNGHI